MVVNPSAYNESNTLGMHKIKNSVSTFLVIIMLINMFACEVNCFQVSS